MIDYLLIISKGFLGGLVLAIMIGPVFFGLIQTSLEDGMKKAAVYAMGVASSDFLFVMLTVLGVSPLLERAGWKNYILITGGLMMIIFGIIYLRKSSVVVSSVFKDKQPGRKRKYFVKGFLLNALNPAVLFFWIGPIGYVIASYSDIPGGVTLYLGTLLLTVFLTDILKAWSAARILSWLSPQHMNQMNKVVGVALFIAGLIVFWKVYVS